MNILITGAKGFVGRNLAEALRNIQTGKDKAHAKLNIENIYEYDIDTPKERLDDFCSHADIVFNFAGVNRPKDESEFAMGNFCFVSELLNKLESHNNRCPVMLASSIQASCNGKYAGSAYGKSKRDGEELFFGYAQSVGIEAYVYRLPNIFGKWCRPNYNSVVATFCNNIANDLPIQVNDRNTQMELVYIDDLVEEMLGLLQGKATRSEVDDKFCYVPITYNVTLGEIVDLLYEFANQPDTLVMPELSNGSFAKKLYSTYLSYLPEEKVKFTLKSNADGRGSFTELLKTRNGGQFSLNISKPGVTKGEHWHNSKWEFFIVVSGRALIQERKIGTDKVLEFEVSGDKIEAVHMLPGYTHNIINLSDKDDLITLMWANEQFDANRPDTFAEKVVL